MGQLDVYAGREVFDQISKKQHDGSLPVLAVTQEHGAVPRHMIDYHVSVSDKSLEGYQIVEKGDFIISLRSFQGGIEHSEHHGICSPAYVILRPKAGSWRYLKHLVKTDRFIGELNKNIEGLRDGKLVSYRQFSDLLFPLPSVPEQEKVAECLSSIDELIGAEGRKLGALKAYKKGLMQQLFPAEGETIPRLRFPKFREAPEWEEKTLGDVAIIRAGATPSRADTNFYQGGTIPWVKTTDLTNSFIVHTEECITSVAKARVNPETSVLVAMYGGFNQIGRTGYLTIPAQRIKLYRSSTLTHNTSYQPTCCSG